MDGTLYMKKKLNPLQQRMLCAKFGWNWPSGIGSEKIFFWYLSVIFLWKTAWAFISWHTRMFCAKFGLNGPVTLERKTIMWNVNDNNDNKDYDMTSSIRKTHLSLQLRWAKKMKMASMLVAHHCKTFPCFFR